MTLHTVNKSPFIDQTLHRCLAICTAGDSLLLIEDGTYGAVADAPTSQRLTQAQANGVTVYALDHDLAARGLNGNLLTDIKLIDYTGFVQLSCEHQNIHSWY